MWPKCRSRCCSGLRSESQTCSHDRRLVTGPACRRGRGFPRSRPRGQGPRSEGPRGPRPSLSARGRNGRAALCVSGCCGVHVHARGFHRAGGQRFPHVRRSQCLIEQVGSSRQIVVYAKRTKCLLCARSWLEAGEVCFLIPAAPAGRGGGGPPHGHVSGQTSPGPGPQRGAEASTGLGSRPHPPSLSCTPGCHCPHRALLPPGPAFGGS